MLCHIRDLQRIHCYFKLDSAKLLATALVSSRLEYCNSLLYGIVDADLKKLQRAQSCLARVVTTSPPFTRIVTLLRSHHCLPVTFRILFQISLLTCKSLHGKQPFYLHSMLALTLPSQSLRSNKGISLSALSVTTNTGARAFHSCAPFCLELLHRFRCWILIRPPSLATQGIWMVFKLFDWLIPVIFISRTLVLVRLSPVLKYHVCAM